VARVLFVCPLIENPRPNYWEPKILTVLNSTGQPLNARWTTTDALRTVKWACGVAEVTPEQLTAIQGDTQIHIVSLAERALRWVDIALARRTRLRTLLEAAGIAVPTNSELLKDIFTRIVRVNEPPKSIDSIEMEIG
jgi:hypothetical protein